MCGIALLLERVQPVLGSPQSILKDDRLAQDIEKRLRQRGPDHFGVVDRSVDGAISGGAWHLRFCSAVLHLRGDALTPQPLDDVHGNVLCWNGELFDYQDAHGREVNVEHGNDTQWVSELLARESETHFMTTTNGTGDHAGGNCTARIVDALRHIHGPFAFVWFHAATQRVFFGHDRFGRRSLLVHSDISEHLTTLATSLDQEIDTSSLHRLVLSSVALSDASEKPVDFVEVPANGIFVLDVRNQRLGFHAYEPLSPPIMAHSNSFMAVEDRYNCGLPQLPSDSVSPLDRAAHGLLTALSNAVGVRVRTIPASPDRPTRVGVLFSGGLDSVVLAALTHFHVRDPHEAIDLLNVCFDSDSQFQSPDRLAAILSYQELCVLFPTRHWRFVCVNEEYDRVIEAGQKAEIVALLRPCDTHMDFNIGAAFWCLSRCHGAVLSDTQTATTATDLNAFLAQQGVSSDQRHGEAALEAVALFGLPRETASSACPVVNCKRKRKPECALGVCRVCCFKIQKLLVKLRPRPANGGANDYEQRASRAQLIAMLPHAESASQRVDKLLRVVETHWGSPETIMCRVHRSKQPTLDTPDDRLEDAPAPSGSASIPKVTTASSYTTTARVLLVGIGADEQLGGYGRHKTAFLQGGTPALQSELALDMARIWKRNLGRDDRCISAHAREARFPFLDEGVVQYIASLPLATVCDFSQPRGRGDKLVLRHAATILGLENCTRLAKRAIQFGSRIAKHANVASFGSNRQASGDAKLQDMETHERE